VATANDILARVKEIFPDFDTADTASLRWLQEAHNHILHAVRLKPTTSTTITLVADQQEYTLSDDVLRVWAATYYESAGSYSPLRETSYDELDLTDKTWRDQASSQPNAYYDLATVIGLYPKPATATSGGYPKVTIYVSSKETLAGSTTMPSNVPDHDAWIHYVATKFTERFYPEQQQYFAALAKGSLEKLATYILGRQVRNKPRVDYAYTTPRNI
jgi:cell wall assembly regulator SMI1